jgi:peptidoglycan/LPS O-acetylase OafA/YrhL
MPQLDGLRALAIASVMLAHFEFRFLASVPLRLGVDLFFVLSGFLITRILLRGEPTPGFIGGFYIRRALRLFPLYYLALAVILIFSADTRAGWPYFTFYAANFWVTITQRWGDAAHFWSLAVEEQFYLIWPFVVLFVSRRVLTRICVCLLIASPLFRMAAGMWLRDGFADVLLPGSLDGLACGALLATTKFAATPRWNLAISSASIAATGFAVLYCGFLIVTCALPLFCVLVMGASVGFGDAWGKLLSLPFVRYVGRISYGLYVIHFPVTVFLLPLISLRHSIASAICAAVTFGLAALSWHFLENPINERRDRIVAPLFGGPHSIQPAYRYSLPDQERA